MKLAFLFALTTLTACLSPAPPEPNTVVTYGDAGTTMDGAHILILPDAGNAPQPVAIVCTRAALNLARIGCPTGSGNFVDVCSHAENSGQFNMKPACLADAHDVASARACGTVTCK